MRFITEFEIHMQAKEAVGEFLQGRSQNELGKMIVDAFNWNVKQHKVTTDIYTIEIEAFPMDKWIEFKQKLFSEIATCNDLGIPVGGVEILGYIKELESFKGQ